MVSDSDYQFSVLARDRPSLKEVIQLISVMTVPSLRLSEREAVASQAPEVTVTGGPGFTTDHELLGSMKAAVGMALGEILGLSAAGEGRIICPLYAAVP